MTQYLFGGTPDSFVEDRDTGLRMGSLTLTILDAVTGLAVAGLATGDGLPAASISTDAYGYYKFRCESASVLIEVTDSLGTTQWGPISSAVAMRDALAEIQGHTVVDSVNGQTGAVVLTATDVGAAASSHGHTADQIVDLPTFGSAGTLDVDAWLAVDGLPRLADTASTWESEATSLSRYGLVSWAGRRRWISIDYPDHPAPASPSTGDIWEDRVGA